MKPADLKPGDRLDTEFGTLAVIAEPLDESGPESAARYGLDYRPADDRVLVDVQVIEPGRFGDADRLPEVTGAAEFQWMGLLPLRYRLAFRPDTDVQVAR